MNKRIARKIYKNMFKNNYSFNQYLMADHVIRKEKDIDESLSIMKEMEENRILEDLNDTRKSSWVDLRDEYNNKICTLEVEDVDEKFIYASSLPENELNLNMKFYKDGNSCDYKTTGYHITPIYMSLDSFFIKRIKENFK